MRAARAHHAARLVLHTRTPPRSSLTLARSPASPGARGGKITSTTSPPAARADARSSAPCAAAIALTIASPSPDPAPPLPAGLGPAAGCVVPDGVVDQVRGQALGQPGITSGGSGGELGRDGQVAVGRVV